MAARRTMCETTGSATQAAPTVTQALVAGGYTLYWRHGSATQCADAIELGTAEMTMVPGWWKSCDADCAGMATARQLDAAGVMTAMKIGAEVAGRGVPIGRVRASEFCRCVQTAMHMAFPAPIEQEPGLTYFVYDEAGRCASSMAMLAEPPAAGSNTAHVSHSTLGCGLLDALAPGEAAIYKPDGMGGSVFVTSVKADQWQTLP